MTELLATLGGLVASLANVQNASVLRERILLAQDQIVLLSKHVSNLEIANAALQQKLGDATAKLGKMAADEDFVEHHGAHFKKQAGGGFQMAVYCGVASCHAPAAAWPEGEAYQCSRCNWFSNFTDDTLPAIRASLPTAPVLAK